VALTFRYRVPQPN